MKHFLELLDKQRYTVLEITEHLAAEQYNVVPSKFNNNIIWNLGHILTITDSLLYRHIPLEIPAYKFDITGFKKGTKPEKAINEQGIILIREALTGTVPYFKEAHRGIDLDEMSQSNEYQTIGNEKVREFVLFHEKLHFLKIQRLISYL